MRSTLMMMDMNGPDIEAVDEVKALILDSVNFRDLRMRKCVCANSDVYHEGGDGRNGSESKTKITHSSFGEIRIRKFRYHYILVFFFICSSFLNDFILWCTSFLVYSSSRFQRSSHAPRICTAWTSPISLGCGFE
jgi:hypothetical protein